MNEKTNELVEDTTEGYKNILYSKTNAFSIINMDLILGLPGESIEEVKKTLKK